MPGASRSGARRWTTIRRSGSANGNGLKTTALTSEKIATFGADAKREHQHRDGGERRLLPEDPKRLHEILSNGCHGRASRLHDETMVSSPDANTRATSDADDLSPVPDVRRQPAAAAEPIGAQRLLEIAADNLRVLGTHAPPQERFGESRRSLLVAGMSIPLLS